MEDEMEYLTRDEIRRNLASDNEFVFDPSKAQPTEHVWVKRGIKYVCESKEHAQHEAFVR